MDYAFALNGDHLALGRDKVWIIQSLHPPPSPAPEARSHWKMSIQDWKEQGERVDVKGPREVPGLANEVANGDPPYSKPRRGQRAQ